MASGGSGRSFSGHRRLPIGPGFILLFGVLVLFVTCGGGEKGSGPVRTEDPTEENPQRVSAVRPAPSFLDRANAFVDGTGGLLANTAGEASKTLVFALPILGIRVAYPWALNRAKHVKLAAGRGEAIARWEDAVALATSTVESANQARLNESRHPTPMLTHNQEVERVGPRNPLPAPPPPPLVCPSYEEMIEQQVFKPDRLLLGVSHEGPVYRSPRKHGSMYITAISGYGKSNEMAFLGCQTIDQDGVVDLLDPHSVKEESLYNYLGPALTNEQVLGRPMGLDAASVKARLREIKTELYAMLDGGSDGRPRLILVDEGNALATHDDRELRMLFLDVAQMCAQQMRAFNVSMVVAIQHPTVSDLGGKTHGGAIRDCFGYSLCGHVPYKMAPIALRIAAANAPKDTEGLEAGEFYIVEGSRPLFLKTPLVTKADFVEVARRRLSRERVTSVRQVRTEAALSPAEAPEALEPPDAPEIAPSAPRRALVEDVDDTPGESWKQKVVRLKAAGKKDIEIVREMWGAQAATGRAYDTKYLPRVTGVMAEMAQQYGGAASPLEGDANAEDDLLD